MSSVYVPPAASSGQECSGGCSTEQDVKYQYLAAYFNAHMLSMPSHRYEYITWFALALVILIIAFLHHVGLGDRSYIGAAWSRWALKKRLLKIGKKEEAGVPISTYGDPLERAPKSRRKVFTFPSFGRTVLLLALVIVPIVLTIVGADYINPSDSVFDMSQSWPNTNISPYTPGLSRRARLMKRLQWGIGSFPPVTTVAPSLTLPYRTFWTAGGRTGGMTNALTPFVVVIALKQVPFALLSTKLLGGFAFDRLSFMHKWGGRVVWLFATAHVVLWSVQLTEDQAFGQSMWYIVFMWNKFRWGWVSYGFFTLLVLLSIGPLRTDFYEFFYVAHVVCAIGFMVTAWLHHPPLGPWMYATLLWWLLERIVRAIKVAYINGVGFAGRRPQIAVSAPMNIPPSRTDGQMSSYGRHIVNHKSLSASSSTTTHSESKMFSPSFTSQIIKLQNLKEGSPNEYDNTYSNRRKTRYSARYDPVHDVIDGYAGGQEDGIALQPISNMPRYTLQDGGVTTSSNEIPSNDTYFKRVSPPSSLYHTSADHYHRSTDDSPSNLVRRLPQPRPAMAADIAAILRPGFAYAQLLPGKTLRLTLRTPNGFSWKVGQYINLNVPKVRWWQSHPFSIASAHNADYPSSTMFRGEDDAVEKGLVVNPHNAQARTSKGEERTIVLLLRARAGFTFALWDYVRRERERQIRTIEETTGMQYAHGNVAKSATGVHVRAIIDGPYGSSQRIKWGIHSSIVIICGGSGVSYGIAVLEYLCAVMAGIKRNEKNFQTRRVRFIWILREYSHLQWVASALRRCVEMIPPEMLQVDLYVTSLNARQHNARRTLHQTIASHDGLQSTFDFGSGQGSHSKDDIFGRFTEGPDQEEYEVDAYALTQFDGEDFSAPTATEAKINERVHKEGKLRRANTRKATIKRNKGRGTGNQGFSHRTGGQTPGDETVIRAAQAGIHERAHRQMNGSNSVSTPKGIHQPSNFDLGDYPLATYENNNEYYSPNHQGQLGGVQQANISTSQQLQIPRPSSPSSYFNQANQRNFNPTMSPLPMSPSPYDTPRAMTPSALDGSQTPDPFYENGSNASFYHPYPASSTTHLNTSYGQNAQRMHHGSSSLASQTPMYSDGAEMTPTVSINDVPIDLDEAENADMGVIAELARVGYPKLDKLIREEVEQSIGRVLVSACGPNSLGNLIRSIVSKQIDLKGIRAGKPNAHINVVTESYEWGG